MVSLVLKIVLALAPVVAAAVMAWLKDRPARKLKEARRENARISRDVRAGDVDAVNDRLRRWRDEDD